MYFIALSHILCIIFKNLPLTPQETGTNLMGNKLYLICTNSRLNPLPIYLSRVSVSY